MNSDGTGKQDNVADAPLVRDDLNDNARQTAISRAQMMAEEVATARGQQAPAPLTGKDLMAYWPRLLRDYRADSKDFGNVEGLVAWLNGQRRTLSSKSETAKAMDYGLKRIPAFTRFLDDGRICLSNNAAERAMRCVAMGRKNWTFAGSDAGGRRAAAIYTLIETCMCGWPPRCKSFVWIDTR